MLRIGPTIPVAALLALTLIAGTAAFRKDAVPILISQLRETRSTKEPIYDHWSLTTPGDIAYFILNNLFADSDWKIFHMPGLEALYDEHCHSYAEDLLAKIFEKAWTEISSRPMACRMVEQGPRVLERRSAVHPSATRVEV
jgi:hypothetical protein